MDNKNIEAKFVLDPKIIHKAQVMNPFEKVSNIVFSILEDAILSSELEPGYRLNVTKIADTLQVSATPVREAINQLQARGLVIVEQKNDSRYSNYYVFDINNSSIQDLFIARKSIESMSAYLCAQKNWKINLDELGKLAKDFQSTLVEYSIHPPETFDPAHMADCDRRFHSLIVESAGNKYLQKMYETLGKTLNYLSIRISQFLYVEKNNDNFLLLANQHMAIYRAIKLGFPDIARDSMDEHIDYCVNICLQNRNLALGNK